MKLKTVSFLVFILTCYNLWQVYSMGYISVKWFTPLLCYTSIYLLLLMFAIALKNRNLITKERSKNVILLNSSLLLFFSAFEILIRSTGYLMTYHEKRYGYYKSYFDCDQQNWYRAWTPNNTHYLHNTEFNYIRTTNSLGLSDTEPTLRTDTNEIRILTLGDSFTEGDGAPYDSSYPQLLKDIAAINYPNAKFTIINAGVSGSDPYYNYVMLKDRLIKYKPDIVISVVMFDDLMDIYYRGDLKRFNSDGTVTFNSPPFAEHIAAVSAASRIFLFAYYQHGFVPRFKAQQIFDNELLALQQLYSSLDNIGKENNFKIHLVLEPKLQECKQGGYKHDMLPLKSVADSLPYTSATDLLAYYNSISATGEKGNLYYWPKDKHHNSTGYKLMAEGVFKGISPLIDTLVAARYSAK